MQIYYYFCNKKNTLYNYCKYLLIEGIIFVYGHRIRFTYKCPLRFQISPCTEAESIDN